MKTYLASVQEKFLFLFRRSKELEVIPYEFVIEKAFDAWFSASETDIIVKSTGLTIEEVSL